MRPRLRRLLVAPLVLPHEAGHALPAWAAGLDAEIELLPEWEGTVTPLGRFDAAIGPDTPLWLLRLIAVAPLVLYVGVAAALGSVVSPASPAVLVAFLLLSFWASLSGGDVAVAAAPAEARRARRFVVRGARWHSLVADALTLVVVVVVAVLLLR